MLRSFRHLGVSERGQPIEPRLYSQKGAQFLGHERMGIGLERTFAPHVLHSFSHCPCCEAATRAYEQNNRALSFERMTRLVQLDGTGQFAQRQT